MLNTPLENPPLWQLATESRSLPSDSRFPDRLLYGVRATSLGARDVLAPFQSHARLLAGDELLELEPVVFDAFEALRSAPFGMPVMYCWLPGGSTFSLTGALYDSGDTLVTGDDVWLGIIAQDELPRDFATWVALLASQWGADSGSWSTFAARVADQLPAGSDAPVIVVDHAGLPLAEVTARITLSDGADAGVHDVPLTAAHKGNLQAAVAATGGPLQSVFSRGATQAEVAIVAAAGAPEPRADRWAAYDDIDSSADRLLITPAKRHISVTDLNRWFAPPPVTPAGELPNPARFTTGNLVEPFINGYDTFAQYIREIQRIQAAGGELSFFGWDFHHRFDLIPRGNLRAKYGFDDDADLTLQGLMEAFEAGGGDARFLVNRFFQLEDGAPLSGTTLVIMILVFLIAFAKMRDSPAFETVLGRDIGLPLFLGAAIGLGAFANWLVADDLSLLEPSDGAREDLDALGTVNAVWSPYPATKADNPLASPLTGALANLVNIDHVGVYHQKAMLARDNDSIVGYLGGIDINPNRRDDELHNASAPYHDTHVRLRGPVAADLYNSFQQRWKEDAAPAVAPLPAPGVAAGQAPLGAQISQIARTYFHPDSGERALSFAPAGDFTIRNSLIGAIDQAQDYIYIEDQYFTPPDDYLAALLNALDRIRKLVILVPRTTDQPLGALGRSTAFNQLVTRGGDKVLLLAPVRRAHATDLPNIAAGGRCMLGEAMPAVPSANEEIVLQPAARAPRSAPFWLSVDGELMYVHEVVSVPLGGSGIIAPDEGLTSRFRVRRGQHLFGRITTEPRAHEQYAAAMLVQMDAIYVHSKMMIVDDAHFTIGSANVNRRGHDHDGEVNVFSMAEHLRGDPQRNVAKQLRMRLWADHLGLPRDLARPLLSDPIKGLELFERPFFGGNRSVHPNFFGIENVIELTPGGSILFDALKIAGIVAVAAEKDAFFDTIVDPSS